MSRIRAVVCLAAGLLLFSDNSFAQQYISSIFAGEAAVPTPIPALTTGLQFPWGVAADNAGNVYFTMQRCCVYRIDPSGVLTLVAGNGKQGYSGDGGLAVNATLNWPVGVALSGTGELYIADFQNGRVRKVSPDGTISTVAGSASYTSGGDGGPAVNAGIPQPSGIAIGADGSLYIAESLKIRKVTPDGLISTIAGNGVYGFAGDGGPALSANLAYPSGIAVDGSGMVYFIDTNNNRIRSVSPSGIIATVAGSNQGGFGGDNGPAVQALISINGGISSGIATDQGGDLFFSDWGNNRIREITAAGTISTVAGTGAGIFTAGAASNPAAFPYGVALDGKGNLCFVDGLNLAIRRMSAGVISTIAGSGGSLFRGDGGPATLAPLNGPSSVTAATDGSVYIADTSNDLVRKVSPSGIISTIAGNGSFTDSGDGGPAVQAVVSSPVGIALDGSGNIYISEEYGASPIRMISPNGKISTIATASTDGVDSPGGIVADGSGNLYISDMVGTCTVRKMAPNGTVSIVAGNGSCGFSGDGGPATSAQLYRPSGLALDSRGNLYIADSLAQRVREVSPQGIITSIAGNKGELTSPEGVAFDSAGALYIADGSGILKITASGAASVIGAGGEAITVDGAGNVYVVDEGASGVRVLKPFPKSLLVTAAVNAATQAQRPVAPGEAIVLYGFGFASGFNQPSGSFTTQLAGTTVLFNGIAAPILYTYGSGASSQVGVIAPFGIAGSTSVSIVAEYQNQTSDPITLPVSTTSPGIFTANQTGSGQIAVVHTDGTFNSATNPVKMGGYITLYATGAGQSSPDGVDGQVFTSLPSPQFLQTVSVTIGGVPANVTYAGYAPGDIAGIVQINVQVPEGIQPGGYVPVTLKVGQTTSQGGLTVAVTN